MSTPLLSVESDIATFMVRFRITLVPVLLSVVRHAANRMERPNLGPKQFRAALGAAGVSAFLEAAQKLAEHSGMPREAFAQGLRIHADEIEEDNSPSNSNRPAGPTRH